MRLALIFLAIIFFDQTSKAIFLKLNLSTLNKNLIFGLFNFGFFNIPFLFLLLSILLFSLVISKKNILKIGLTLLFSGGIGNLIDRLRLGATIDFITLPLISRFNLADLSISLGFLLLLCYFLTSSKAGQYDGEKAKNHL